MRVPVVVGLAAVLPLAGPAHAQWDLRLSGDYQSSRTGPVSYRASNQELTARRIFKPNEEMRLSVTGRLRHAHDLVGGSGMYHGNLDADLRTSRFDAFFRMRPDQRQTIHLPSNWRHEETSWGGVIRTGSGPSLAYREGRRRQHRFLAGPEQNDAWDRRLEALWSVRGLDLNYSFGRARNQRKLEAAPIAGGRGISTRDHTGGVQFMRTLPHAVTLAGSYRHGDSHRTLGTKATRLVGNQAESQVNLRPWSFLMANLSGGWMETRNSGGDAQPTMSRNLDATGGITLRPVSFAGLSLTRSFQEQRTANRSSRSEYLRAQLDVTARPLPDLRITGNLSRSQALVRRATTAPSDMVTVGVAGRLRPGADLSVSLSGVRIDGAPAGLRFQSTQSSELRLTAAPWLQLNLAAQSTGLDRRFRPWAPDNGTYRADAQASFPRGTSVGLGYSVRMVRESGAGKGRTFSAMLSTSRSRASLSWTGSATQADHAAATANRSWGYGSAASVRLRLTRRIDVNASHVRSLPATGFAAYTWMLSAQQSLR